MYRSADFENQYPKTVLHIISNAYERNMLATKKIPVNINKHNIQNNVKLDSELHRQECKQANILIYK